MKGTQLTINNKIGIKLLQNEVNIMQVNICKEEREGRKGVGDEKFINITK